MKVPTSLKTESIHMDILQLYTQFSYILGVFGISVAHLGRLLYERSILPLVDNNNLPFLNDALRATFIGLPGKPFRNSMAVQVHVPFHTCIN